MTKPYDWRSGKRPTKAQLRAAEREQVGCDKVLLYGPKPLGYLEFFEDAQRREKRGEKQTRCASCKRYRWPDEQAACPDFVAEKAKAAR